MSDKNDPCYDDEGQLKRRKQELQAKRDAFAEKIILTLLGAINSRLNLEKPSNPAELEEVASRIASLLYPDPPEEK